MKTLTLLISLGSTAAMLIVFTGCLHSPVAPQESPDFMEDFQQIWIRYQSDYPLFMYKEIDWIELGNEYYNLVNECNTREEFYLVLEDFLALLQDRTICFETFDGQGPAPLDSYLYPWQNEYTENVDYDVLLNNYLQQYGFQACTLGLGYCDPSVLPYLMIDQLAIENNPEAMLIVDSFIGLCNDLSVPAMILDLRVQSVRNSMSDLLAGRFAEKTYTSVILRSRGGPDYWNYYDVVQAVRRTGPEQYTGTVLVLMGEQNCGGTEILCAELSYNPDIVLLGDRTMGSVSFVKATNTTSDIAYHTPDQTVLMRDGTWLEEEGVPADIYVETTPEDFASGTDPVLEHAIDLLVQYR